VAPQDHCSYKVPTTNHHIKKKNVSGPARGLVVSASTSVLVGREFDSRPGAIPTYKGLTKTL